MQEELAKFKVGDLVRYKGQVGVVASVSNLGHTLSYCLCKLNKVLELKTRNVLAWYVEEEDLELVKRGN